MSAFVWIDHSEKQRRQVLEAIDQFREKDTRDELGTAGIRDALADLLFPGTGALQTRARYFLFVPWMYWQMEARKVSSAEIARKTRDFEIRLIDALASSSDHKGTIGIEAREHLQRVPSNIYWNGLGALRIRERSGSQMDYQRSLDRFYQSREAFRATDDGDVAERRLTNWDVDLPPAPDDWPSVASFVLTKAEADYLREMIRQHHPDSLLAFVLDQPLPDRDIRFVWDLDGSALNATLTREVEHARCFSELRQGASILYNWLLARMDPVREDVVERCEKLWEEWLELMAARRPAHRDWSVDDFWHLLSNMGSLPKRPTIDFVTAWHHMAIEGEPRALLGAAVAHDLIRRREYAVKGALARCENRRAREMWRGESGLGQVDYRWANALTLIRDIRAGLGGDRA
jgi:hypothetical protein